ncbi:MAG: Ig-like domain-containing protein, partial [Spirochaetales bacterium]|nr:Ig-like domain-containing protein [Spirochaetales bacterium]
MSFQSLIKFICVIYIVITTSCSFFNMSPLLITEWSPEEELLAEAPSDFSIKITFSATCNKLLTEKAFSLQNESENLSGTFEWNSDYTSFTFTPFSDFSEESVYEITISTSAEDKYGNSLDEEFYHKFSMQQKGEPPKILSYIPEAFYKTDLDRQEIIIGFSRPVPPQSWLDSFSISPSVSGTHTWNDNHTIYTFSPCEELIKNQEYTISINYRITDYYGNTMGEGFTTYFSTGSEQTPPQLLSITDKETGTKTLTITENNHTKIINSGWECDDRFILSFSEPVKSEEVTSFIEIDPSVSFEINDKLTEYQQNIELLFNNKLEYDTVYRIIIGKGIEDVYGNLKEEDSTFYFLTDGKLSCPPLLNIEDGVAFLSDPSGTDSTALSIIAPDSAFPSSNYVIGTSVIIFFDFLIIFADPINVDSDPEAIEQAFLENLSFSTTNSTAEISVLGAMLSPPSNASSTNFSDTISPLFTIGSNQRV